MRFWIRDEEMTLKKLEEQRKLRRDTLKEEREELEEQQEILQWEHHEKAKEKISLEEYEERDEIAEHLQIWKNQLTAGRTALGQYELILGQYEEAASLLEETKKKKAGKNNGWRWQKNKCRTESMHGSRKSFTERRPPGNGIRNVRSSYRRNRKQDNTSNLEHENMVR